MICPYCFESVDFLDKVKFSDEYLGLVSDYACEDCAYLIESEDLDFEDYVGNYDPES